MSHYIWYAPQNEVLMINIVIPTLSRFALLMQTIGSIQRSIYPSFRISIVVDGDDLKYRDRIADVILREKNVELYTNHKRIGWGRSINSVMMQTDDDYYFSASDDLTFQPATLTYAFSEHCKIFPDGDGVVGINQGNMRHFCPGAFVLADRKWINRFPDRQMYFPMYKHFCVDSELWHYALSEKRFHLCKTATVTHNRPHDDCHKLAQRTLKRDRVLWWFKKGNPKLYWGNFNDLDFWKAKIKKAQAEGIDKQYNKGRRFLSMGGIT